MSKAKALASAHVFAIDGVKTLCLGVVNNRIEIGVRAESNTRQLRSEILALLREKAEPGTFDEKILFFLNFYKEDEFHLL